MRYSDFKRWIIAGKGNQAAGAAIVLTAVWQSEFVHSLHHELPKQSFPSASFPTMLSGKCPDTRVHSGRQWDITVIDIVQHAICTAK